MDISVTKMLAALPSWTGGLTEIAYTAVQNHLHYHSTKHFKIFVPHFLLSSQQGGVKL